MYPDFTRKLCVCERSPFLMPPPLLLLVSFFVLFISQVGSIHTLVNINYTLQFRWPFISRSLCTFLFLTQSRSLNSRNHRTLSPCPNLVQSTPLESFFRPVFLLFFAHFPAFLPSARINTNKRRTPLFITSLRRHFVVVVSSLP